MVVESMSTGKRVGLLWMDTTGLQELLRSTLQRALGVLCMVLEVAGHERLIAALTSLQKLVRRLCSQPVSLPEFSAFLRTLSTVQEGGGGVTTEIEIIQVRPPQCRRTRPRLFAVLAQVCDARSHRSEHAYPA